MSKKYYWALFHITKNGWNEKGMCKPESKFNSQHVIDVHPLIFQAEMNEKYGEEFEDEPMGHTSREQFQLLNWKELTKEEYENFKDLV